MNVRKISLLTVFALLSNFLPQYVSAEEYRAVFSYFPSEMRLDISISSLPAGGTPVGVSVFPQDMSAITAEAINSSKAISRIFFCEPDGTLAKSITLPQAMPSGSYKAVVSCEFGRTEQIFSLINPSQAQSVIDELNSAQNSAAFIDIINNNTALLGIDSTVYAKWSARLGADLFAQRNLFSNNGYTLDSFNLSCNSLAAQYSINDKIAPISEILQQYADLIGISYNAYAELNSTLKDYFEQYVRALDTAKEPLYKYYDLCILKAKIAATERYQELQSLIEESVPLLNIDTGGLTANEYAETFRLLFEKKNAVLSDITNTAALFQECKTKVLSKKNPTSGSSSGSSDGIFVLNPRPSALTPAPSTGMAAVLTDINGHWAESVIKSLFSQKVVSGYEDGSFKPDECISRAEFITMIVSALDMQTQAGTYVFSDVSDTDWYCAPIVCAASNGIIYGYDNEIRPTNYITRQDAAVIIYRALLAKGYSPNGLAYFEDKDEFSDYAYDPIYYLAGAGIIHGYSDDKFMPFNTATRAEVSQLLYNAIQYVSRDSQKPDTPQNTSSAQLQDSDYILASSALGYLGVNEYLSEDIITRSDFVGAVVKAITIQITEYSGAVIYNDVDRSDKNYDAICYAYENGLIRGGNNFNPDSAITRSDAVKICAAVIDASVNVYDDDYLTSYSSKLLKNLSSDGGEALTKRNAAVLIYNMISNKRLAVRSEEYPITDSGDCIMSALYNMYTSVGIVIANELTALSSPSNAVAENRLLIGGSLYEYDGGEELLGYRVTVLYTEPKNGIDERTAICILPDKNNEVSLLPRYVEELSSGRISYSDSSGRRRYYALNSSFDYIYNEKSSIKALPEDFSDFQEILLIDNDNDRKYDVMKAVRNEYMIISTADYQNISFHDKYSRNSLELSDNEHKYAFADGRDIYDIAQGTAISYATSDDGLYTKISILDASVSGRLTAAENNTRIIDKKEYYCTGYYLSHFGNIDVGTNGEFILDSYGNLVAANESAAAMSFGFLVNMYDEDGIPSARIFTDSGQMTNLKLCDKVLLDSASKRAEAVMSSLAEQGKIKRQLIRYSLNADGEISIIDTKTAGGKSPQPADAFMLQNTSKTDRLVLCRFGEPDPGSGGEIPTYADTPTKDVPLVYTRSTMQFYPKFNINGSIVFVVPSSENKAYDSSMYYIGSSTSFKQSTDGIYNDGNVLAYNINNSGSAEAIVYFTDSYFLKPAGSAVSAVIESIYDGYSDDYGECTFIKVCMSNKFYTYILDENMVLEKRTDTDLAPGDVIRFTAYNDVIKYMVVDFDAAKNSFTATAPAMFNVGALSMSYQSGLLYSVNDAYIHLAPELGDFKYDTRRTALRNVKINVNSITVVHIGASKSGGYKVEEISPASPSDLHSYEDYGEDADYIVMRQDENQPKALFAYRFDD